MARLVVGAVGAVAGGVIGYYTGGPTGAWQGAAYGWTIGAGVGSLVFPADGKDQYGPRLSDLKVQSATYGIPIPIVYGTSRVAGNAIWITPKKETSHEQSSGGKGGGGSSSTTFTYSQSVAMGICEGPITGISKIWVNGKLVYNPGSTDADTVTASATFAENMTIYLGSETQVADPVIQADVGAANTPSFKGIAYIVFEDFQLADYGNSLPNFEFETSPAELTLHPGWAWGANGAGQLGINSYATTRVPTTLYGNKVWKKISSGYSAHTLAIATDDTLWGWGANDQGQLGLDDRLNRIIPTQIGTDTWLDIAAGASFSIGIKMSGTLWGWGVNGDGQVGDNTTGTRQIPVLVGGATVFRQCAAGAGTAFAIDYTNALWAWGNNGYGTTGLGGAYKVPTKMTGGSSWELISVGTWTAVGLKVGGSLWAWGDNSTGAYGNGTTTTSWTPVHIGSAVYNWVSSGSGFVLAIDDYKKLWSTGTNSDGQLGLGHTTVTRTLTQVGTADWEQVTAGATHALGISFDKKLYTWGANDQGQLGDGTTTRHFSPTLLTDYITHYASAGSSMSFTIADHVVGGGTPPAIVYVDSIITDICSRVGLTAGSINVSALTADVVTGYVVQRGTARSWISQLMQAYYFDVIESDGIVKFVKRGGSSVISIPEDDLAAHEHGSEMPDQLFITRKQEVELPCEFDIQYKDVGMAYQVGTQIASRIVTDSDNKTSINLAISMTGTKAKQIADVLLFDAWTSRTLFQLATAWKYSYLEPTDVIQVTKDSRTYTVRLVDEDCSGGIWKRSALMEDATIYTQTIPAAATITTVTTVVGLNSTRLELMDIPILRDSDDGMGVYVAACGSGDGRWPGCSVFRSIDAEVSWQGVLDVKNQSKIGDSTTTLGNFSGGNTFDESNSVTVNMTYGELSSVSELLVLAGENTALLGNEVIQFKIATFISTGVYKLTGLLRGRRGTEWAMGGHTSADRFIVLTPSTTYIMMVDSSEYNTSRSYKGVTFGGVLADADSIVFSDTGVASKPYSVVQLAGTFDYEYNLILSWMRRTRIGGSWSNNIDVPIGETSESYQIDTYDATFSNLISMTTVTSSPTILSSVNLSTLDIYRAIGSESYNNGVYPTSVDTTLADPFGIKDPLGSGWSINTDGMDPHVSVLSCTLPHYFYPTDHRDVRTNAIMFSGYTPFRLTYTPSGGGERSIFNFQPHLVTVPLSGTPEILDKYAIYNYFSGYEAQFDDPSLSIYTLGSTPFGCSPQYPAKVTVFGCLIYSLVLGPLSSYSTVGKIVDITNILTDNLTLTEIFGYRTYRSLISGDVISSLDDHDVWSFADKVSATQAAECTETVFKLINIISGDTEFTGTLDHTPIDITGDYLNDVFYTVDTNGVVRKVNLLGTTIELVSTGLHTGSGIIAVLGSGKLVTAKLTNSSTTIYYTDGDNAVLVDKRTFAYELATIPSWMTSDPSYPVGDYSNYIEDVIAFSDRNEVSMILRIVDIHTLVSQYLTFYCVNISTSAGIKIYQMSSIVGRGYSSEITI